ncbi:hypothetical protein FACS1894166_02600 [Bacilli bacterium]|nr:hypothetical protein FACS1894166_02600 [Bacilli bacterium]
MQNKQLTKANNSRYSVVTSQDALHPNVLVALEFKKVAGIEKYREKIADQLCRAFDSIKFIKACTVFNLDCDLSTINFKSVKQNKEFQFNFVESKRKNKPKLIK